jgi:hypothetical protein
MTLQTVAALLAAVGAGSVVSYFVTGAPERRKARAEVRRSVLAVERLRMGDADHDEYRDALRDVIATSLTARVPRSIVDRYVYSRRASWAIAVSKGDTLRKHAIMLMDREVSQYLTAVGELLVDFLWHPTHTRMRLRRRLKVLDMERDRLGNEAKERDDESDAIHLTHDYWDV